ncbi:ras association domain-containing protein 8-like isoform X1 [Hippocampus comes]|uniref:ras association domain-containing protein 8-like isoform X1 n=1 Tax=Hippocampus comes TaxID=109280 RepID=UPI00094E0057|nr:PREDICTED: ras association domain-containing protein 8-like isoform X1 [Hippocampus comes]XP_019747966.1 PREDICTED: ras association domain-containing protein 8-like isoform X1 [Hippocampus comes]
MEMKVWVEDTVRVVCGISQTTSCQDVVISLAQAIGQTGRYILISKLRGTERKLGADECPLQHLNKLGQLATEVQFILRRTGPSLSDGQEKKSRVIHPALLKPQVSESSQRREPEKTHTFHLSVPTVSRRTKSKQALESPREPNASPVNFLDPHDPPKVNGTSFSSKEEIFRQILQQQRMLKDLQLHLKDLEDETEWWEHETASATIPGRNSGYAEELDRLEQWFEHNEAEQMQSQLWRERLQEQLDREQELQNDLHQIQTSVLDHNYRIEEVVGHLSHLERNMQLESSQVNAQHSEGILRTLQWELSHRMQQSKEMDDTLSSTLKELQTAEDKLRGKWETIEELKKELRQCNLQHFIQQTSGTPLVDQTTSLPVNETFLRNAGIMEGDKPAGAIYSE